MADEKKRDIVSCTASDSLGHADVDIGTTETLKPGHDDGEAEVFGATGEGQVNFRTVGWIRASIFLMKQTFATGVLSMPSAMYYLGGVASPIFIIFWGLVNTRSAYIQGEYKLAHPRMHTIIDGAQMSVQHLSGSKFWGKVAKYIAEVLYLMSWLLCVGLAVLAIGTALNAITKHGTCTVAFNGSSLACLEAWMMMLIVRSDCIRDVDCGWFHSQDPWAGNHSMDWICLSTGVCPDGGDRCRYSLSACLRAPDWSLRARFPARTSTWYDLRSGLGSQHRDLRILLQHVWIRSRDE